MDVDHFKKINDSYGHATGDDVLKRLSDILAEAFSKDLVGRTGGEEFAIVIDSSDEKFVTGRIGKLLEVIRKSAIGIDSMGNRFRVTCSAGIAREDIFNLHDGLSRADVALYSAKAQGRDRWVVADPTSADDIKKCLDELSVADITSMKLNSSDDLYT
jgi:diguanylate cyclase (GGDEF)-like protein